MEIWHGYEMIRFPFEDREGILVFPKETRPGAPWALKTEYWTAVPDGERRLLEQGNSVSFACNAAGFKSTSAFINAFRLRTNMTPAEYKRSYKQEQ